MRRGQPLLLDTCVLLHLARNKELGQRLQRDFDLSNTSHRPLVCVVTLGEIWSLARHNQWGDSKREFLKKLLSTLVVIDINADSIIDAYVEVDNARRQVRDGARSLSKNDIWIAAAAVACEATLLTTDSDFLFMHPNLCQVHHVDMNSFRESV